MPNTNTIYLAIVVVIGVVSVVWFLRKRNFNIEGSKSGFQVKATETKPDPGISAKGVTSKTGTANLRNEEGTGVTAEDVTAHKDVNITNTKSPKT